MVQRLPRPSLSVLAVISIGLAAVHAGGAPYTICPRFSTVCSRQSDRCDRGSVHPGSHRCGVALHNTRASPSCSSPEECFRRAGFPIEQAGFRRFQDAWDCSDCCKAGHSEDECRFDVPASRCSVSDMISSCPAVVSACQSDGLCLKALTSYRTNGCSAVATCWDDLGLDEGADGFKVWNELKRCHQCCADFVHGSNDHLERFPAERGAATRYCDNPLAFLHPLDNALIALPSGGREVQVPIEWTFAGAESGACEGAKCVYNLLLFHLGASDGGLEKPTSRLAILDSATGGGDVAPVHLGAVFGQQSFIWVVNPGKFAPGNYLLQVQPVFFGSSLVADRHITLASTGGKDLDPPATSSTAAATLILTVVATVMFVLVVVLCAARKQRGTRSGGQRWTTFSSWSGGSADLLEEEQLPQSVSVVPASPSRSRAINGGGGERSRTKQHPQQHHQRGGVVSSHSSRTSASIGIREGKRPLLAKRGRAGEADSSSSLMRAKSHEPGGAGPRGPAAGYNYGSFYHSDDSYGPVPPAASATASAKRGGAAAARRQLHHHDSGAEGGCGGLTTDSETGGPTTTGGDYFGEGQEGFSAHSKSALMDVYEAKDPCRAGRRRRKGSRSSRSSLSATSDSDATTSSSGGGSSSSSSSSSRIFPCPYCSKTFKQKGNLTVHVKIHLGIREFNCGTCGRLFAKKQNRDNHARTHTGERPFTCSMCPMSFARRNTLTRHFKTHTGARPYHCQVCGRRFVSEDRLDAHRKTHDDEPVASGDGQITCRFCPLRFTCRDELARHSDALHADAMDSASAVAADAVVVTASAVMAAPAAGSGEEAAMMLLDPYGESAAQIVAVPIEPQQSQQHGSLAGNSNVGGGQLSPIPIPGAYADASRLPLAPQSLNAVVAANGVAMPFPEEHSGGVVAFSTTPPSLSPIPVHSLASGARRSSSRARKLRPNPPTSPARSTASTMTTASHHSPSASPRRRRHAAAAAAAAAAGASPTVPLHRPQAASPTPLSPLPPRADLSRPASPLLSSSLPSGGSFASLGGRRGGGVASPRTVSLAADMLRAAERAPLFHGTAAADASDSECAPDSPVFLQRAFSSAVAHIRPGTPELLQAPLWEQQQQQRGGVSAAGSLILPAASGEATSGLSPLRAFSKQAAAQAPLAAAELEGASGLGFLEAMAPSTPGRSSFHFPSLDQPLAMPSRSAAAARRPFDQFSPQRSREELVCPHCRLLFDSESFGMHRGACPLRPVHEPGQHQHHQRSQSRRAGAGGGVGGHAAGHPYHAFAGAGMSLPTVPEPHRLVDGYDVADAFLA